jgi:hypothetical protein
MQKKEEVCRKMSNKGGKFGCQETKRNKGPINIDANEQRKKRMQMDKQMQE